MRLRKITLREIHLRLLSPFETSFGKSDLRRILLFEADVDGVTGWGESTAGENPFYSYETVETAWLILRDHLWPLLKEEKSPPLRKCGTCSRPCAGTTWPKPHSKPRSGTPKPSKKICHSPNFSAARATKFPAAFRSESSQPLPR